MAKKKQRRPGNQSTGAVPTTAEIKAKSAATAMPEKHPSTRGGRETVEALVIAFVLAFLIRTFQAEPFVIPTGSMAPTLMGVHKDIFCDQCGQRFRVNASDEVGDAAVAIRQAVASRQLTPSEGQRRLQGIQCAGGVCPQCRYVQPIRSDGLGLERALVPGVEPVPTKPCYSGDRLVVNKYTYSFGDPERWDILVFKYPGNGQMNYIKRLVGLPGEELRLFNGNLFAHPAGESEYKIAPKPPSKMLAMRHLVYDSEREPASLHAAGWPLRWRSENNTWSVEAKPNGKTVAPQYQVDGSGGATTAWLRYHHTPPGEPVWQRVLGGEKNLSYEPKPGLVTDFIAYNTRILRQQVAALGQYTLPPTHSGLHWVGDLMVEADVKIESASGKLLLELVEAGTHYGCEIDIATGEATLWQRAFETTERVTLETAATSIRGKGNHEIRFANFDDRLVLWVDGNVIPLKGNCGDEDTFDERYAKVPQTSGSDAGDLAPASIGSQGAKLSVRALRLWRDTYYLADDWRREGRRLFVTDYDLPALQRQYGPQWMGQLLSMPTTPEDWGILADRRHVDFELAEDQFFVMGDNSPESLDARLWAGGNGHDRGKPGGAYLERHLLVGKAVCVYWPHSWYTLPLTGGRVPIWPNFTDMRLVR